MRLVKGDYCAAINCKNNRGTCPQKSFFRFPLDPERCKKWVFNCGRKDLHLKPPSYLSRNCKMCMDHFEGPMFLNDLKNRLQPTAIPTLFAATVINPPPGGGRLLNMKRRKRGVNLSRPPIILENKNIQCSLGYEEQISDTTHSTESEDVSPASPKEIHINDDTTNLVIYQVEYPMIVYEKPLKSPEESSNTPPPPPRLHQTEHASTQTVYTSLKEDKLREKIKEKNLELKRLRCQIQRLQQRNEKLKMQQFSNTI